MKPQKWIALFTLAAALLTALYLFTGYTPSPVDTAQNTEQTPVTETDSSAPETLSEEPSSESAGAEQDVTAAGIADLAVTDAGFYVSDSADLFSGALPTTVFSGSLALDAAALDGVSAVTPQLYVATIQAGCCESEVRLVAFDPDSDFILSALRTAEVLSTVSPSEAIVGINTGYEAGDTVSVWGTEFTVTEVLAESGDAYDSTVYVTFSGAQRVLDSAAAQNFINLRGNVADGEQISILYVKTDDDTAPTALHCPLARLSEEITVTIRPNDCCETDTDKQVCH